MKILWASPLPPVRSGVSDYAVDLLEALSIPSTGAGRRTAGLAAAGGLAARRWRGRWSPTDAEAAPDEVSLVHLGNNPHHLWLLDRLGRPRTAVVLHDLVLHHLLVEAVCGERRGRISGGAAFGGPRRLPAQALASAREVGFTGRRDPFMFPATKPLSPQRGCDRSFRSGPRTWCGARRLRSPVGRVGLPVADPGEVDRMAVRQPPRTRGRDVVLMHLGFLTPEKGLAAILSGVAAAVRAGVAAQLVLVGEGSLGQDLARLAEAAGIGDRVVATGWIETDEFLVVAVSGRSRGRSPDALRRRDIGCGRSLSRLRDTGCSRRPAPISRVARGGGPAAHSGPVSLGGPGSSARRSGRRRGGWAARRRAARQAYEDDHTPERAADQLLGFLEQTFQRSNV